VREADGHLGGEFAFVAFESGHDGLDDADLFRQLDLSKSTQLTEIAAVREEMNV